VPNYIQLLTLTPEGRERLLQDPEYVLRAQRGVQREGVQVLGVYAVLGSYDFVSIVEAPDNESVARFSIELGVRGGVHITTLPAVPVALLEDWDRQPIEGLLAGTEQTPPRGGAL
jgi:uncharacterized protein with GYD domain